MKRIKQIETALLLALVIALSGLVILQCMNVLDNGIKRDCELYNDSPDYCEHLRESK